MSDMRKTSRVARGQTMPHGDLVRILIADDDELFARMLRTRLNAHAHLEIVGMAANGREAVALAQELEPDLVLMDVGMPVLDGIEATRELRALAHSPKVVLISGQDDDFGTASYDVGADAYLRKSVDLVSLIDVIATVSPVVGVRR